jgi:hypothetical protein
VGFFGAKTSGWQLHEYIPSWHMYIGVLFLSAKNMKQIYETITTTTTAFAMQLHHGASSPGTCILIFYSCQQKYDIQQQQQQQLCCLLCENLSCSNCMVHPSHLAHVY